MKIDVISVGRPGPLLAEAITEYEARAARYWPLRFIDVRSVRATKGSPAADVREAEGKRLLGRVRPGSVIVALTRVGGDAWSSARFSTWLQKLAAEGGRDHAFLIGGATGLADSVLRVADRRMRLSTFTLPHDVALLLLAEQFYRAGTIARGQPYHKGAV